MVSLEVAGSADSKVNSNDTLVMHGAAAMLHGHLAELRAIKSAEAAWLDRFSVLLLPFIIFLFGTVGSESISKLVLAAAAICYFIVTLWFQEMLRKERGSYYRVARSTVRLQNFLGLIESGLVPQNFSDPFPKGFGPNSQRDGTQPFSSYFRRQLFTSIGFAAVICGILLHDPSLMLFLVLVPLDALWIIRLFRLDRENQVRECLRERALTGTDPSWYPVDTSANVVNDHFSTDKRRAG